MVRLDKLLERVDEFKDQVLAAVLKEFPTYTDFDKRRIQVYLAIARGFLSEQAFATYEIFIEYLHHKKPPVFVSEARRICVPYQKRVMRTVHYIEKFYPDESMRRKEVAAKELEEELKTRSSTKAEKESEAVQALTLTQQENVYLKSLLLAHNICPSPVIDEPASDDDVLDITIKPLTLEDAPATDPLALEDVDGPGTPVLTPEEESDVESDLEDEEDDIPVNEVTAPLIARIDLAIKEKKKKPVLYQAHTVRRKVEANMKAAGLGLKFVAEDEADTIISVPSRGTRGHAFRQLVGSGKSFFLLIDVTFLCRPEFISACSAGFTYQLEYVPDGSVLTVVSEDREQQTIAFKPSVWVCHKPKNKDKDKVKSSAFSPAVADEMSVASTVPDLHTTL